jgi:hypothetical protein
MDVEPQTSFKTRNFDVLPHGESGDCPNYQPTITVLEHFMHTYQGSIPRRSDLQLQKRRTFRNGVNILKCLVISYIFTVMSRQSSSNPQAGGSPTVDCPRPYIQYIHSYP